EATALSSTSLLRQFSSHGLAPRPDSKRLVARPQNLTIPPPPAISMTPPAITGDLKTSKYSDHLSEQHLSATGAVSRELGSDLGLTTMIVAQTVESLKNVTVMFATDDPERIHDHINLPELARAHESARIIRDFTRLTLMIADRPG